MSEYMRIPYADTILLHVPGGMSDIAAISVCDIFNTGYFALDDVGATMGDTVAVYGAGPVGLCAIASAQLFGAGKVIAPALSRDFLAFSHAIHEDRAPFEPLTPERFQAGSHTCGSPG